MQATGRSGASGRPTKRLRAAFIALLLIASVVVTVSPASAATPDTNAWYVLVNRHSGKAMDVWEWSTADGGEIRQFARHDAYNQQWQFVDVGGGYYQLRSRHSGKVLELPNADDGVQLLQNTASSVTRQHFRLADSEGGHVRLISRHSNKALDVWEWSTADGAMISQFADLDGYNQQWQMVVVDSGNGDPGPGPSPDGLVGWATQGGGTTGGTGSATTVSSASALESAVGAGGVVRVSGTISCSGMLDVASNTTIIGNAGATIAGCGFNISEVSNVIVRNLTFRDWDDDAINVQYSQRVWVDHNSFTNGHDGAVDVKRASDFVTVSWNRIFDHDKSMLLGHSDSNASEDVGHLRVTYHHNWFDGSGTRHPRVRFGDPVHVFNNYYFDNEYGVASTMGAGVLVEGNYFENVDDPTLVGYGSSDDGDLIQRNNFFTGSGTPESAGDVNSIPYSYSLDAASSVKAIVTAGAGAGRISP